MAHIRSSNGAGVAVQTSSVPVQLELAALDDLGPRARSVIIHGPMPLLAYPVVSQIIERNEKIERENQARALVGSPLRPYLDPKEPQLDALLAQALANESLTVMLKDRDEEACKQGMRMFRTRRNPKTEREKAIAERRIRRMRW